MKTKTLPYLLIISVLSTSIGHTSIGLAQEAGPGQGLVVFSRKSSMKGAAMRFNIEHNGVMVGQLPSGTTLEVPVAPGSHTFSVRTPSLDGVDFVTIDVEAGKTYHVTGDIRWGWPAGRAKFGSVTESGVATGGGDPSVTGTSRCGRSQATAANSKAEVWCRA
jgi:hypothetical protein